MRKMLHRSLLTFVSVLMIGCGSTRVVFVDKNEDLVRAGPKLEGRVYFWNGEDWVLSKNKVPISEGAYIGFPLEDEEEGGIDNE